MQLPLYQIDAFTSRVFAGNPAAVCPLEEWLPDATMQAIAVENNLAETAYFCRENGGYRMKVYWDVRFTWGGEFVHAAPWSVGDQGKRNVSHGCMNVSTANAKWFYELSKKGDIIEIVGTEEKVKPGDGWTDWNLTWEQYKAGSALNG